MIHRGSYIDRAETPDVTVVIRPLSGRVSKVIILVSIMESSRDLILVAPGMMTQAVGC